MKSMNITKHYLSMVSVVLWAPDTYESAFNAKTLQQNQVVTGICSILLKHRRN